MPIGIVSNSDLELELNRLNKKSKVPLAEVVPSTDSSHGRNEGDVNVPDSLRQIIGETSIMDGRQEAVKLAEMFGISKSSVSAYANGAVSTTTYDTPKKSIISHINKARQRGVKKANKILNQALESISQDKLDQADAKDLSGIAKDMSAIIKNLEPKPESQPEAANSPQFVIFAPQFRDERSFDTIQVSE